MSADNAGRQPPGKRNALGLVKFRVPNKHKIYLRDTPGTALFSQESRAYSHGCIRLADPVDFAYALLAVQSNDLKAGVSSDPERGTRNKNLIWENRCRYT
ncbi:MAG: L,D-transpeptidase family protein [Rhodobacteraceae bacterium]|nr:L,D-transpeptidase family protein [Paracoccaceae bacterium]